MKINEITERAPDRNKDGSMIDADPAHTKVASFDEWKSMSPNNWKKRDYKAWKGTQNVTEAPVDTDPFIDSELDPQTQKAYGITKSGEKIEINDDPMDKTTGTFDPINGIQKPTEVSNPNKPTIEKPANAQAAKKIHAAMQTGFKQPATPSLPKPGAM